MADKTLGRFWYALYRETGNDAARVKKDPYGWFSCRANVGRFLDIEGKQFTKTIYGKERTYATERSLTLVDGTVLTKSAANTDGKPAGERIPLRKTVGGRRVIIKTGKPIRVATATKPATYHTVSFAFPQWATIQVIADALGEVIPSGKISSSPGATQIYPSFTMQGGGTYGIASQAAAITDTVASASIETVKTNVKAKGGKVQE